MYFEKSVSAIYNLIPSIGTEFKVKIILLFFYTMCCKLRNILFITLFFSKYYQIYLQIIVCPMCATTFGEKLNKCDKEMNNV